TVCELLRVIKPDWLEGKSLVPLFEGKKEEIREEVFGEVTYHASYEPMRSVRTKTHKLIIRYGMQGGYAPANIDESAPKEFLIESGLLDNSVEREALYDLRLDPVERINLANDPRYKKTKEDLLSRLDAWMAATNDPLNDHRHRVPKPDGAIETPLTQINV
ncbi:MAG: hypothetical protein FWF03_04670, partial [Defluviitaleaceae bacterium]|nr:hypothetical protein [Defluviitaleaceae bacterium]